MTEQGKTLKDKIQQIRRNRKISPEEYEMLTGMTLEHIENAQVRDKIIEEFKLRYTPYSLTVLADIVTKLTRNIDHFLGILAEKKLGFGQLARDAEVRAKFEFSAYLLFVLDVFATQQQTHDSRLEIFYTVSNKVLEALQQISPEYKEAEFNKELHERMSQYAAFVREPSMFNVPPDVSIWNLLQENLTNAVAKGGFERKEMNKKEVVDLLQGRKRMKDKKKPLDIVCFAYGATCQRAARGYRLIVDELFTATNDIRCLSNDELEKILTQAKNKTAELDEEDRNTEA